MSISWRLNNIFLSLDCKSNWTSEELKAKTKNIWTNKNPLKLGTANSEVAPNRRNNILFIEPIDVAFDHRF